MSLVTRRFFDKIQNSTLTKLRLPSPPYFDPSYWDRAYKDSSPEDCIEWGGFELNDIVNFKYEHVSIDNDGSTDRIESEGSNSSGTSVKSTSLSQWLNIPQHSSPEEASMTYQQHKLSTGPTSQNDTILLLGCGNSKMGEQLLVNSFQGPFLHLDVSSKVIQCMTQRYERYLKEASVQRMEFIVDDATSLTSLQDCSVGGAVIDKGLFDSLHCSLPNIHFNDDDNEDPIKSIVESVHRVLQPSRPFVFFSRSGPEFMLKRTFGDGLEGDERRRLWSDVSVVQLVGLDAMMYRFTKANENDSSDITENVRVTTRSFKHKNRQKRR